MKNKDVAGFLLWVVMGILGTAMIVYQTRGGPGLASDSVVYLQGAQNLQLGRGFSRTTGNGGADPIADFPPLFSTLLALFSFGNTDLDHLIQIGRWMNAVLFGANILLASWLVRRYTASWGATMVTSGLMLVSRRLIKIHSWLMTEGTFICLLLLAILFLNHFFIHRRTRDLVLASLATGLLTLVRYAGLAFWLSAILALWFFQGEDRKKRLLSMSLFGLLGLTPMVLWSMRNALLSGEAIANRYVGWYGLRPEVTTAYLREWVAWVFPAAFNLPLWLRVLLAITISGFLLLPFLRQKRQSFTEVRDLKRRSEVALPGLLLIALPIYLATLVVNSFILDASTSVNAIPRYLLPGWVCFAVLSVCAVHTVLKSLSSLVFPRLLVITYLVPILGLHTVDTIAYLQHAGFGLIDVRNTWQQEQKSLEQLEPSRTLISTDPERLYLLIGRPSYRTPRPQAVYSREENAHYQEELSQMRSLLQDGAYLIIIDPAEEEETYRMELTRGLEEIITEVHVRVYTWPSQNEP